MVTPTKLWFSPEGQQPLNWSLWIPLAASGLAIAGVWAAHSNLDENRELDASVVLTADSDFDGITNRQERAFGTSPFLADSDGDGYDDGEELAFGSSPVVWADVPDLTDGRTTGISLLARGGQGYTHIELLLFSYDGTTDGTNLAMSMYTPNGYIPLDMNRLAELSSVHEHVRSDGAIVQTATFSISPLVVQSLGSIHWIAAIGEPGESGYTAAATVGLVGSLMDDTVVWNRSQHNLPPTNSSQPLPEDLAIDQPIPPFFDEVPGLPPGNAGQVCVQMTQVVGEGAGATIITEVVAAACEVGWAAFCVQPVCVSNIGRTFEKVNPRNLLGG